MAGSMNMDIVTDVRRHPLAGETIHGIETSLFSGGKGANQAVAAARFGASVSIAGALGDDCFGDQLIDMLAEDDIELTHVKRKSGSTGIAHIIVNNKGENSIVVSKGANGLLTEEDVADIPFEDYDMILLQNEIPWEVNSYIIKKAKELGVKLVFNPAPAMFIPEDYFHMIDILILNEQEAAAITHSTVNIEADALQSAQFLVERGVGEVIVTLGKKGAVYMNESGKVHIISSFDVPTVDTTGAGDTFIGAYAAKVAKGASVKESLLYASAAAAIAVSEKGAQQSLPAIEEVREFLRLVKV